MKVRVLVEAQVEAVEAAFWYDKKQSGLGHDFLSEVEIALIRIGEAPQSFSRWEHYEGPQEIRRAAMKRFPYSVIFIPENEESVVVAVAHSRRKPLYWLSRLS